jgi:hypothetical protein
MSRHLPRPAQRSNAHARAHSHAVLPQVAVPGRRGHLRTPSAPHVGVVRPAGGAGAGGALAQHVAKLAHLAAAAGEARADLRADLGRAAAELLALVGLLRGVR